MQYAIVGMGAVGKTIGAALASNGHMPLFITRGEPPLDMDLTLNLKTTGESHNYAVRTCPMQDADGEMPRPDVLMFAVRAQYLRQALADSVSLIHKACCIVFLQGGIQAVARRDRRLDGSALQTIIDPQNCLDLTFSPSRFCQIHAAGLVGFGATAKTRDTVDVSGPGSLKLGAVGPCGDKRVLNELQKALACAWIQSSGENDIARAMINKACGTFGLNSASLLWGKTLGELTRNAASLSLMRDMANYAVDTYKPLGFKDDIDFESYFRGMGERLPSHRMAILAGSREIYTTMAVHALIGRRVIGRDAPHLEKFPEIQAFMAQEQGRNRIARPAVH